jgi:hypothetical protein
MSSSSSSSSCSSSSNISNSSLKKLRVLTMQDEGYSLLSSKVMQICFEISIAVG